MARPAESVVDGSKASPKDLPGVDRLLREPEAAALVESLNNGNQMVPTLVFSDGTSMTNPSAMAVKEKLSTL